MKIIKRGVIPSERVWSGHCITCKSQVEAVESEITHIIHDPREGSHACEKCPVCNEGTFNGLYLYPRNR